MSGEVVVVGGGVVVAGRVVIGDRVEVAGRAVDCVIGGVNVGRILDVDVMIGTVVEGGGVAITVDDLVGVNVNLLVVVVVTDVGKADVAN